MTARRVRILIIVLAALVIAGIFLIAYNTAFKPKTYEPIPNYSSRFLIQAQVFATDTGVFQQRDYYPATSTDLSMPDNGRLLINPIQLAADEQVTPRVQQSSYAIENTLSTSLFTRLTNSKRTSDRSGTAPSAAILALEYQNSPSSNSWQSLTLYNVATQEELVDSALIFAPASSERATTWQGRVSLFLTDGDLTNHAAALLPGVNILNQSGEGGFATGVIYTNRPFSIGGLPAQSQDRQAHEALEYASATRTLDDPDALHMDISQRITGTDLIFSAPAGRDLISSIQAPASTSDTSNNLTILDGVIAIDPGVTLVVGSGEIGRANSILGRKTEDASQTGTVTLSPRAIIVDGGTLVLSNTNARGITVNTSIQVRNGGTLKIGENVVVNGNIYAFAGGRVEVLGNFVLNGSPIVWAPDATLESQLDVPQTLRDHTEQLPGGIFIFSDNCMQADGTLLGGGSFYASVFWLIDGNNGIDPLIMSRAVHFLSTEGPSGYLLMYSDYRCSNANQKTYHCEHFGSSEGGERRGIKLGFSRDMAVVELFVPTG
ncbi:MAG: hypothetical protein FWE41_05205 [Coriobacteriia bacterium]|nr:hypothetical protein [Coriobacteriia bacterium]MCL2749669.1 hypothetical protein [Coriobacteriia bacterium]